MNRITYSPLYYVYNNIIAAYLFADWLPYYNIPVVSMGIFLLLCLSYGGVSENYDCM